MREDVEIRPVLGDVVAADTFRGHAGVRAWYDTVTTTLEGFRVDVERVIEADIGRLPRRGALQRTRQMQRDPSRKRDTTVWRPALHQSGTAVIAAGADADPRSSVGS
jgi:hypothetical protein